MSTISWLRDEHGRPGRTWNPIRARHRVTGKVGWHCEPVHEGCRHCYAAAQNRAGARGGTKLDYKPGHRGDVELFLDEKTLYAPLSWKTPLRIFPCSMTDLCGPWVKPGWFARILDVIFQTPRHTYIVLTKRPERLRALMLQWGDLSGEDWEPKLVQGPEETRKAHPSGRGRLFADYLESMLESAGGKVPDGAAFPTFDWAGGMISWPNYPLNLWAGPSCSTQADADRMIPEVLATPLAKRIASFEPLLGDIDLTNIGSATPHTARLGINALTGEVFRPLEDGRRADMSPEPPKRKRLDLAIVGGLNGPEPTNVDHIRSLVRQCRAANVPVFVKQVGRKPFESDPSNWPNGYPHGDRSVELMPDGFGRYFIKGLKDRKGEDPREWPEDLRVREWPGVRP